MNLPPQIPVAVFMTRFAPGGTERQMIEVIRRLNPRRFAVHVVCFDREGAWLPRVLECGVPIVEFPIRGVARLSTLAQIFAFARWCRRKRIAVVQTCGFYTNIFGLPGAALAGVPVRIGSRRELNPDKSAWQLRLQTLAYRAATKVVANSQAGQRILHQEGIEPASIAVIPNGLDHGTSRERKPDRPIRTVITVANLRPEKNHEILIVAAATVVRRWPGVRFLIVGDGPRRADLQALAQAHGLSASVDFLGHRDDVPALLDSADLFVLPSRSEASPNSALEAMAAGLPIVASAVGGLVDLIDDGRTGLLVPPGNPDALARAIACLVEDPDHAHVLGRKARESVIGHQSFDGMVAAFESLYLSGLGARVFARSYRARAAEV